MEAESHQPLLTVADVSIPATNIKSFKDARTLKGNMRHNPFKNWNPVQNMAMPS